MSDTTNDPVLDDNAIGELRWEAKRLDYYYATLHPVVEDAFDTHPWLRSVAVCVAQFWNDEADDAVHVRLVYSQLDEPDVDHGLVHLYDDGRDEEGYDEVNLPAGLGVSHHDLLALDATGRYVPSRWDANGAAIELFASYCSEGAHQDMAMDEAFSVWALVRHGEGGEGTSVEVVGDRCRPWLDGVPATWSD